MGFKNLNWRNYLTFMSIFIKAFAEISAIMTHNIEVCWCPTSFILSLFLLCEHFHYIFNNLFSRKIGFSINSPVSTSWNLCSSYSILGVSDHLIISDVNSVMVYFKPETRIHRLFHYDSRTNCGVSYFEFSLNFSSNRRWFLVLSRLWSELSGNSPYFSLATFWSSHNFLKLNKLL